MQHELAAVAGRLLKQVLLRADGGFQRGDQLFADGVERRIGHLGKELLEIVVEQAGPSGQNGQRDVIAHGADRFFGVLAMGARSILQVLFAVAEDLLADRAGARFPVPVPGNRPVADRRMSTKFSSAMRDRVGVG